MEWFGLEATLKLISLPRVGTPSSRPGWSRNREGKSRCRKENVVPELPRKSGIRLIWLWDTSAPTPGALSHTAHASSKLPPATAKPSSEISPGKASAPPNPGKLLGNEMKSQEEGKGCERGRDEAGALGTSSPASSRGIQSGMMRDRAQTAPGQTRESQLGSTRNKNK